MQVFDSQQTDGNSQSVVTQGLRPLNITLSGNFGGGTVRIMFKPSSSAKPTQIGEDITEEDVNTYFGGAGELYLNLSGAEAPDLDGWIG